MFAYPAVLLPSFWVSVAVMTEVANTAGFALNFGTSSRYHFNEAQVGYVFFSGFIGAALGEIVSGPLCDLIAKRSLRREEVWRPERLLKLSLSGLLTIMVSSRRRSKPYCSKVVNTMIGWIDTVRLRARVRIALGSSAARHSLLRLRSGSRRHRGLDLYDGLLSSSGRRGLGRFPVLFQPHVLPSAFLQPNVDSKAIWSKGSLPGLCLPPSSFVPGVHWSTHVEGTEHPR